MASDPLDWIDDKLATLERSGLRRRLATRLGPQRVLLEPRDERPLVNFGSNDYLGLAAQRLGTAIRRSLDQTGWGSGASPLVTGRGEWHARLERELAAFEGAAAALLFPSGFAANFSTLAALIGPRDAVFGDARNHASILDGCRLSGARWFTYPHGDAAALSRQLEQSPGFRRRLIVTDTLFSMDGDLAPLAELAELAERFGAMLMVDEAHATGVFGAGGRGVCEAAGVERAVHVRVGTLSKALGSIGGFVVGEARLIEWLANRARAYVFSTASPEAAAAAGLEALKVVQEEPQRRQGLLQRAAELRQRLQDQGWSTGESVSQIVPVIVGRASAAVETAAALRRRGLLVPAIRPPSVPRGRALLRISLSSAHTPQQIEQLVAAFRELRA